MRAVRLVRLAQSALIAVALSVAACTTDNAGPAKAPAALSQAVGVPDCGFENGAACPGLDRCDRGLDLDGRGTPLNTSDDI